MFVFFPLSVSLCVSLIRRRWSFASDYEWLVSKLSLRRITQWIAEFLLAGINHCCAAISQGEGRCVCVPPPDRKETEKILLSYLHTNTQLSCIGFSHSLYFMRSVFFGKREYKVQITLFSPVCCFIDLNTVNPGSQLKCFRTP